MLNGEQMRGRGADCSSRSRERVERLCGLLHHSYPSGKDASVNRGYLTPAEHLGPAEAQLLSEFTLVERGCGQSISNVVYVDERVPGFALPWEQRDAEAIEATLRGWPVTRVSQKPRSRVACLLPRNSTREPSAGSQLSMNREARTTVSGGPSSRSAVSIRACVEFTGATTHELARHRDEQESPNSSRPSQPPKVLVATGKRVEVDAFATARNNCIGGGDHRIHAVTRRSQ